MISVSREISLRIKCLRDTVAVIFCAVNIFSDFPHDSFLIESSSIFMAGSPCAPAPPPQYPETDP